RARRSSTRAALTFACFAILVKRSPVSVCHTQVCPTRRAKLSNKGGLQLYIRSLMQCDKAAQPEPWAPPGVEHVDCFGDAAMTIRNNLLAGLLAAAALALPGTSSAAIDIEVQVAPPAPVYEAVPPPREG